MLRQLAKASAKRHQHAKRILTPHLACLSTAPMPKQQQPPTLSYQEWAARNAAAKASRKQRAPTELKTYQSPRLKPKRYNSIVHLPGTVTLTFPQHENDFQLECVEFAIAKPGKGGHVVLGRNGAGKSLLVQQLAKSQLFANDKGDWTLPAEKEIGYVSFDSHIQVIQDHPDLTVHDSITGGTGNLSKAAQYLVVRFGLFPLLHRTLSTLSTGEIRKALLVSALAKQPKLLILENAFDGLDAKSREELKSIVSKTIEGLGKSGKLLVQQVNADYVPPAQVLLSTHRPEEIVHGVSTVSYIAQPDNANNTLLTIQRPPDYSQEQIMFMALGLDKDHNKNTQNWSLVAPWEDQDPTLPSHQEIQQVWPSEEGTANNPLVTLDNVTIRRRRDGLAPNEDEDSEYATLLHQLNWDIQEGQRWLIGGGNGAGKSTLTRFLLQSDVNQEGVALEATQDLVDGNYQKEEDTTIGWVSTESHLGQVGKEGTVWDLICHNGKVPESVAETMIQWVFGNEESCRAMLQERSLQELSQGEQKLALLASALALRPKLLILDEPTQGLDWVHRRRILALLERVCEANPSLSLAFITHYQEEWIPAITHVLHLDQGKVLYQGERKQYNPDEL